MDLVPIDVILSSGEANGESVVNLDAPNFIMDELRDVVGVTVLQASIPFSYYVFDNTNNQFRITVTATSSTPAPPVATYLCTITPGSYNSINLVPQLNNAFATSVRQDTQAVRNLAADGFRAWVDVSTSCLVVLTSNVDVVFTLNFTSVTNSAAAVLGFYGVASTASVSTASVPLLDNNEVAQTGNYVTSPFSVNLSGENLLFLHSSIASSVYGTVRTHTQSSDILQFMTVNNNYQGMIEWVNPNPTERKPMTRNTITKATFYFTLGFRTRFQAGSTERQYLEFRGQPFQLALRFYQINDARIDYISNGLGDRAIRAASQTGSTQMPQQTRPQQMQVVYDPRKRRAAPAA